MPPSLVFAIIWIGWAISWAAAAFWSGRTEKQAATSDVWLYRLMTAVGVILLWHRTARLLQEERLWHVGYDGAYALAALALGGIVFAWWARIHLGRLWSGSVTRKEGHHVVDTGPYALVRHPIYTGILGAALATTLAKATLIGIAGFAFLVAGLWVKARYEEGFLQERLEAYGAYRARVPMLVPWT